MKMLKIAKVLGIIILAYMLGDHLYLLYKSDISIHKNYKREQPLKNPHICLVSYADGHPVFFKNQLAQAYSALNKGFTQIYMYQKSHIDADFYHKNKHILDSKVGAGYWLWKPYFLLKTLEAVPENSVVVYADSPVMFIKPIDKFIKLLNVHDVLLLKDGCPRKKNVRKAGHLIKKEALEKFNLNTEEVRQLDNLWSCLVIVKNTPTGRKFVQKWLENCQVAEAVMNEPFDTSNQNPGFLNHAHDQSVLVITSYQCPQGVHVLDTDDIRHTIKNVHRHPNAESKSLLPDILGVYKFSEYGYNSRFMKWVRSFWNER